MYFLEEVVSKTSKLRKNSNRVDYYYSEYN